MRFSQCQFPLRWRFSFRSGCRGGHFNRSHSCTRTRRCRRITYNQVDSGWSRSRCVRLCWGWHSAVRTREPSAKLTNTAGNRGTGSWECRKNNNCGIIGRKTMKNSKWCSIRDADSITATVSEGERSMAAFYEFNFQNKILINFICESENWIWKRLYNLNILYKLN